ncbi:hypothetical protein FAM09_30350 [Niastella caeni]|uniref:Uncharacterized protein n=1 Tax=Niastella caeni TaxID=2569763 RepID=A0A4S8H8Q7_9BACT|nr:hypothetical protein [Niastella caeni]THU30461.1 hypothetical protein FAM09_30350 [Niastella caeni]
MKKKKTPLTRKRVLTNPVFELTRQNNTEFSRAVTANRLLHHAFIPGLRNMAHRYVSGRLTKIMFKILQSDQVNGRGERRVPQGVLSILEGFNFNRDTSLQNVFRTHYSAILDRDSMRVTISIPSLIPKAMIDTASGANAFMLTAMAASLHFEKENYSVEPVQTDLLDISLDLHENLQLHMPVIGHQPDNKVVAALGIEFFHKLQGTIEPVAKVHNALAVIKVF